MNIYNVLTFILGMNKDNCKKYDLSELTLTGDYSFGAREQFLNEARMAVRLANFISAFLQVCKNLKNYISAENIFFFTSIDF